MVHFTNGGGYIIDQDLSLCKSLSPCPKKMRRTSYIPNFFIYGCINHTTESKESVNKLGFPESGFFFLSCWDEDEEEGIRPLYLVLLATYS